MHLKSITVDTSRLGIIDATKLSGVVIAQKDLSSHEFMSYHSKHSEKD